MLMWTKNYLWRTMPMFFKVAHEAGIGPAEIIDLQMVDITYTKLFNSAYGQSTKYDEVLRKAQQVRIIHI